MVGFLSDCLYCQSIGTVGQDRTVIPINMFLHLFYFIPLYLSRLSHRVKEHSKIRGFSMGQYGGQRGDTMGQSPSNSAAARMMMCTAGLLFRRFSVRP